jgi:hypothetical protein
VSSYSYMIVPTSTAPPFNADKGKTLSKFILYVACAGQQEAALLGYSPLPKNLVQADFDVVRKIPGHVEPPPIDQCDNPTITGSFVTNNAPPPPPSDRQGATPPTTAAPAGNGPALGGSGGSSGTGGISGRVNVRTTGKSAAVTKVAKGKSAAAAGGESATPIADQTLAVGGGPISAPAARDPLPLLLYVVAGVVALLAVFGPPALGLQLRKRRSRPAPLPTE